MKRGIYPL